MKFLLISAFAVASSLGDQTEMNVYDLKTPLASPLEGWDLGGVASVVKGVEERDFVQLTSDEQSKRGTLWHNTPLLQNNWEVEFDFRVRGHGSEFFGDGFAFWFAKEPKLEGSVFGSSDMFHGFGVFFDTFDNGHVDRQAYPFISVMYGDGTQSYENADRGLQQGTSSCHAGASQSLCRSGGACVCACVNGVNGCAACPMCVCRNCWFGCPCCQTESKCEVTGRGSRLEKRAVSGAACSCLFCSALLRLPRAPLFGLCTAHPRQ